MLEPQSRQRRHDRSGQCEARARARKQRTLAPRKPVRHGFCRSRLADRGRITTSPSRRLFPLNTISRVDCEPVLSAMPLAEADDALIIGDQRTASSIAVAIRSLSAGSRCSRCLRRPRHRTQVARREICVPQSQVECQLSTLLTKASPALPEPRRFRDKTHVKFVAKQPCLICGRMPSDAHHLRFAQPRALGRKVSDELVVPLCRGHHREVHRSGDEASW